MTRITTVDTPFEPRGRAVRVGLVALTAVFYLWTIWHFFNYLQDDSLITLRYALNYKMGNGWVLTAGDPVEGYTSPLHLWLTTLILQHQSVDAAIFALKFIGAGLGVVTLLLTGRLARIVLPNHPLAAWLAPLIVAWHPGFGLSMINGMETSLATLFLTYGITCYLEEDRDTNRSHLLSLLAFIAAALTRPELTVVYPVLLIVSRRHRWGLVTALAYLAAIGCFELWRHHVYGSWLPNTYYAKWNPISQIFDGVFYLCVHALPAQLPPGLLVLIGGYSVILRQDRSMLPLIVAVAVYMLWVVASGGDWMQEGRFVTPILPAVSVAIAAAYMSIVSKRNQTQQPLTFRSRNRAAIVLCALILLDAVPRWVETYSIVGAQNMAQTLKPHAPLLRWSSSEPMGRINMALWVGKHAKPGQLVVTSELGLVSVYNPKVNFVDFRGLADSHISRMSGYVHGKYGVFIDDWMNPSRPAAPYLLSRRPDFVIIINDNDSDTSAYPASKLYQPSGSFDIRLDHTGEQLFEIDTWSRKQ